MSEPITNLPDAVAEYGAFPMPVAPEPQVLPVVLTEEQVDALAAAGDRVVNDAVHEDLCACDGWPEKCVSTAHYFMGAWDVNGLETALPAVLGLWERMRGSELERLRAEVVALNESLSVAAEALRAKELATGSYPPALPWAALMDSEDLTDFLDELAASAITHASSDVALAEVEATCGRWRLIAEAQHGHNTAPGPDAASQSFAERAGRESDPGRRVAWRMLAEPAGGFDAFLHHENRLGHDLPEAGGTQC